MLQKRLQIVDQTNQYDELCRHKLTVACENCLHLAICLERKEEFFLT